MGGIGGLSVRLDMGPAMTAAAAEGCAPAAVPALLRAVQEGLSAAQAAAETNKPAAPEGDADG